MRLVLVVSLAVLFAFPVFAEGEWPDWRGPSTDGYAKANSLPLTWSETENIVWKTDLHDLGHSTPVVWGDQIWLTTATEDGAVLYAICVDLNSGSVVHDIEVFRNEEPQRIHPNNSYATPSAVVEAGRVYVHYGTFGTACIDSNSGEILWRRRDLNCDHNQGPVSSPVLFGDVVIVHLEGVDVQFIAALNKRTGDTVWRYDRPRDLYEGIEPDYLLKSYQTPVIIEVDGKPQMVSNGGLLVTGHDLNTGNELWRVRYRDDNPISRIVWGNGLLFVNSGGNPGASELYAIRQGGEGDVTESHVVWKVTEDVSHESSPVVVDGSIYSMSDTGTLICLDGMTGDLIWSERLRGKFGSSLLTTGDRIYLSDKKGRTTVIGTGREYRELALNELDGELWASPAVAGDSLLLRTKTHLYRIQDDN